MVERDGDGFGLSSGNSIGRGIAREISSLIRRLEVLSIGGYLVSEPVGISLGIFIRKIVIGKGLVSVASPLGYDWGIAEVQIYTTVESISLSYKKAYYYCVYFMRRELHLFAIIFVFMCGWPLGSDRVVWPYLHVFLPFLRLAPCATKWCPVHWWSGY